MFSRQWSVSRQKQRTEVTKLFIGLYDAGIEPLYTSKF